MLVFLATVKAALLLVPLPRATVRSSETGFQTTSGAGGGLGGGAAAAIWTEAPMRAHATAAPMTPRGTSRDTDVAMRQPLPGRVRARAEGVGLAIAQRDDKGDRLRRRRAVRAQRPLASLPTGGVCTVCTSGRLFLCSSGAGAHHAARHTSPGYRRSTRPSSSRVIGRPVRFRHSASAPAMNSARNRLFRR